VSVKTKRVGISYIRYSSLIQGKGDSIRRQDEGTKKFLKKEKIELLPDGAYGDFGLSGFESKNLKYGALGDIVEKVEAGKIPPDTYLVIESLDRLSRAPVDEQVELFMRILRGSVNIATVDPEYVYTHFASADYDSSKFFMELMVALTVMQRAWEESDRKRSRISKARAAERESARKEGTVLTKMCPSWLKVVGGGFVVNGERMEVVEKIFSMAADERLGSSAIVSRLNEEGVKPWGTKNRNKSGLWGKTMVSRILTDRRVLGEFQPMTKMTLTKNAKGEGVWVKGPNKNDGEPIKDYFPRVIDEDLFYEIFKIRESRRVGGGGRPTRSGKKNIFKGIAKCFCGSSVTLNDGNKVGETKYIYLTCSSHCGLKGTQYYQLERLFRKLCEMSREQLEVLESREQWKKDKESKIIGIEGKIKWNESLILKLKKAIASDEADDLDDVIDLMKESRKEINDLKGELRAVEITEDPDDGGLGDDLDSLIKAIDNKERPLSPDELIRALKNRYESIEVRSLKIGKYGQEIHIVENLKEGGRFFWVARFEPKEERDYALKGSNKDSFDFDDWLKNPKIIDVVTV
jgi:DNA invertase Pin-like site-specific DNA recombinase